MSVDYYNVNKKEFEMKKILVTMMMVLASSAFAASTGTLFLSGTVAAVNDLEITPNSSATSLDIVSGEINKLVATVKETSNSLTGYRIMMRSANSSKLMNTLNNSKNTDYTISYDGSSYFVLSNSDQVVKNVSALVGLTTNSSDIKVNVSPYGTAPAGTYVDTVTISIVAN